MHPFPLTPLLLLCAASLAAQTRPALRIVPARLTQNAPRQHPASGLSFAQRVQAQTALERIYYNHRLWPKENPNPKPPFARMVPAALIEMKAAEPLRMSAALNQFWNIEITPAMLQTELDRMERDSHDRAVLHELFAALGNDPFLIAETLARGNLAEKALRNHYAFSVSLHTDARRRAETAALSGGETDWKKLGGEYRRDIYVADSEGELAARSDELIPGELRVGAAEFASLRRKYTAAGASEHPTESTDQFLLQRALSITGSRIEVESLVFPKRAFDDWWAETAPQVATAALPAAARRDVFRLPAPSLIQASGCDAWDGNMKSPSPAGRYLHSAVWTGSEMIIWGGFDPYNSPFFFNSGSRYNPATDNWIATSMGANVPSVRRAHTAVWTGTEMIVWGGRNGSTYFNNGGRYNPAADTWSVTSIGTNVPPARNTHTAIWTGSEMIIWGGINGAVYSNTGGRYNPATDSWIATSGVNVPSARNSHATVWTGSEMIIWGGFNGSLYFNTGGRYNPATDTWVTTSTGANVPAARGSHTAVWTGGAMIVWGGSNGSSYFNTGSRYDPAADAWITTSIGTNVPAARIIHSAVWTGGEMVIWGGFNGAYLYTGGRYDPATDSWIATSIGANIPATREGHTAVWTGSEMIIWGGVNTASLNTGGRYNPVTDSWLATSGSIVPAARRFNTAIWTGSEMIIWGGSNGASMNTGGRYNPATDTWIATSVGINVPAARANHTAVWSGSEMIIWGGFGTAALNTGGRYEPAADAWIATSIGTNVPAARRYHTAVWTGSEMIIWGGFGAASLNTGGRYNPGTAPGTDSWLPTCDTGAFLCASSASVPPARSAHTAIWTGTEMIVWGGNDGVTYANTGGRYDPATDTWIATSIAANVPAARNAHTAVWTGGEMIVWGGYDGVSYLNTGGRYDSATDTWIALSGLNGPGARSAHTAVWTGGTMIVWGGFDGITYFNTGGRYDPATDLWATTSIGANVPVGRYQHTAAWTGGAMIVWGGYNGGNLNSGGMYTASAADSPAPIGNSLRGDKSSTVDFNWASATGAAYYNVRRCTGTCPPVAIFAMPVPNGYSETMDGNSYFYLIEAVNSCGMTP